MIIWIKFSSHDHINNDTHNPNFLWRKDCKRSLETATKEVVQTITSFVFYSFKISRIRSIFLNYSTSSTVFH